MRWIVDEEGALGLSFWNIVTFVKYKHSVIRYWFTKFPDAPKYYAGEP